MTQILSLNKIISTQRKLIFLSLIFLHLIPLILLKYTELDIEVIMLCRSKIISFFTKKINEILLKMIKKNFGNIWNF